MTDFETIADNYVALWNETDAHKRRAALSNGWHEDAAYVDPLAAVEGYEAISGLVAGVQQQFPGFRFSRLGPADGHGSNARFRWGLGPAGAEPVVEGTDFVTLNDGKIRSVTGFLDKVPA